MDDIRDEIFHISCITFHPSRPSVIYAICQHREIELYDHSFRTVSKKTNGATFCIAVQWAQPIYTFIEKFENMVEHAQHNISYHQFHIVRTHVAS